MFNASDERFRSEVSKTLTFMFKKGLRMIFDRIVIVLHSHLKLNISLLYLKRVTCAAISGAYAQFLSNNEAMIPGVFL